MAVRETSEEKQIVSGKSQGKQTKNGSVGPAIQSGDTSRFKKIEPAVVFTDNAKFNHSVSGLEFGFGFDESIVTTSDNDGSGNESVVLDNEDNKCNNNNNNILKNNHTVTKDFSKCFKAPKNDKISYNYEELIRHVSKGNYDSHRLSSLVDSRDELKLLFFSLLFLVYLELRLE